MLAGYGRNAYGGITGGTKSTHIYTISPRAGTIKVLRNVGNIRIPQNIGTIRVSKRTGVVRKS